MKSLKIKSDICLLRKSSYGGVTVNNVELEALVKNNLPEEFKENKEYPVKMSLQIEILGEEGVSINTEGYKVKGEVEESEA